MKITNSTSLSSSLTALILGTSLALVACGSDDDDTDSGDGDGDGDMSGDGDGDGDMSGGDGDGDGDMGGASGDAIGLTMTLNNLEPLGGGFEYEGWFINEDGPVSGGRFNLEDGETTAEVSIPASAIEGATMYVLTIEPPADEDEPTPSDTHVLAGPWDGSMAELSIDHEAALNDDFSSAAGSFFLQTPTSANEDDYSYGIWFFDPGAGEASLELPELPAGWIYEGWVAGPDGPISTGTFMDGAAADSDMGGPTAGDDGADAPMYPGQDFVMAEPDPPGMINLVGEEYAAVISVEPYPDDSPAPFAFKPLVGMIADDGPGTLQDLDNMAENAPSGSVALSE